MPPSCSSPCSFVMREEDDQAVYLGAHPSRLRQLGRTPVLSLREEKDRTYTFYFSGFERRGGYLRWGVEFFGVLAVALGTKLSQNGYGFEQSGSAEKLCISRACCWVWMGGEDHCFNGTSSPMYHPCSDCSGGGVPTLRGYPKI